MTARLTQHVYASCAHDVPIHCHHHHLVNLWGHVGMGGGGSGSSKAVIMRRRVCVWLCACAVCVWLCVLLWWAGHPMGRGVCTRTHQ